MPSAGTSLHSETLSKIPVETRPVVRHLISKHHVAAFIFWCKELEIQTDTVS